MHLSNGIVDRDEEMSPHSQTVPHSHPVPKYVHPSSSVSPSCVRACRNTDARADSESEGREGGRRDTDSVSHHSGHTADRVPLVQGWLLAAGVKCRTQQELAHLRLHLLHLRIHYYNSFFPFYLQFSTLFIIWQFSIFVFSI